ncbi:DUF6438 domain-containing protein [Halobacillus andaensis]|nr:DUF6438 domain-containing protein [Halobacillus andaensis]MBP2004900.1 hypothetical protein [Halobacillus andaensis]
MFHKLTLARTGCFGDCPVYQVEVLRNGRVSWHGSWMRIM